MPLASIAAWMPNSLNWMWHSVRETGGGGDVMCDFCRLTLQSTPGSC